MKVSQDIQKRIWEIYKAPYFPLIKFKLDSRISALEAIDTLEHILYVDMEHLLNQVDKKTPFHLQNELILKLKARHQSLIELKKTHRMLIQELLPSASSQDNSNTTEKTEVAEWLWVKESKTMTLNEVHALFLDFQTYILDLTDITSKQADLICLMVIQLLSRPNGQRLIKDVLNAGQKNSCSLSFIFNKEFKTTPLFKIKDEETYYLREDGKPGDSVKKVQLELPENWKSEFSIIIGHDQGTARFSFQPAFLTFGHELVHVVNLFTGTSRGNQDPLLHIPGFTLNKPISRLYPDPQDVEEYYAIEVADVSENTLRQEHGLCKRSGHEGRSLVFHPTKPTFPLYVDSKRWSSKLMEIYFMESQRLKQDTFEQMWLEGLNCSALTLGQIMFTASNLEESAFPEAKVIATTFKKANLKQVDFANATLGGVSFEAADLHYARFIQTALIIVSFNHANLTQSKFVKPKFMAVTFDHANFSNATLTNVLFPVLKATDFSKAQLKQVTFESEHLEDLLFIDTLFEQVTFRPTMPLISLIQHNLNTISGLPLSLSEKQQKAKTCIQRLVSQLPYPRLLMTLLETMLVKDPNAYRLLRQETGYFRFRYGNTTPWNHTIGFIKDWFLTALETCAEDQKLTIAELSRAQTLLGLRSDRSVSSFFMADSRAKILQSWLNKVKSSPAQTKEDQPLASFTLTKKG